MPITVEEKFGSPRIVSGDQPSAELLYAIIGTGDEDDAQSALESTAPSAFQGLTRRSVEIEPIANDIWDGIVRYGEPENVPFPDTGESSFAFDTGGGTQHVTHSKDTVQKVGAPGATPPDFQGAIGVTDNGVDGVDITVPVYNFSETHYLDDALVTPAYKLNLFTLTGKVNSGSFRGFAPGECLFLGASGTKRGAGDWEITFRFAGSPNVSGLSVGPINGINKGGWDYLWIRYADTEDTAAKSVVKRPRAAYVERVYDSGNFGLLGIGT